MCIEKKQTKCSTSKFLDGQYVDCERRRYQFLSLLISAFITTVLVVTAITSGNYYSENSRRDYELKLILLLAGISTYITLDSFQKYFSFKVEPVSDEERRRVYYEEIVREAEVERSVQLLKVEGTVESIRRISLALQGQPNSQAVLQFLIAQQFVDANLKLASSGNSKVIFLDPKLLTESLGELIGVDPDASSLTPFE